MKHFSTPAYSMGLKTAAEPVTTNKLAPGAGTYDVRKEDVVVPAPVIGTGKRPGLFKKTDYPGPGGYNVGSFVDAVVANKSTKKREKLIKSSTTRDKSDKTRIDAPGPGSYNPQKQSTSLAHSMGNKTFSLIDEKQGSLGPGQYDSNFHAVETSKVAKIGNAVREGMVDKRVVPGPGAYEKEPNEVGPKYSFGNEKKEKRNLIGDVPPPWAYDIPGLTEELKNKPGKTIGPKCWVPVKDSGAPGPGAYEPKPSETSFHFSVGNGKRSNFTKINKLPGPGEYSPGVSTQFSKSAKIGSGKRPPLSAPNQTPGPGAYNLDISFGGPRYGMSGRRDGNSRNTEVVPGPGQYEQLAAYSTSPHHVIGTGQRSNNEKSRLKSVPGPGAYIYTMREDGPRWTFGKDPKIKENYEDDPGPGQYEIPPSVPDVPKYLLTGPRIVTSVKS